MKLIKIILKIQNFYLNVNYRKELFFEEKHAEDTTNPKELR